VDAWWVGVICKCAESFERDEFSLLRDGCGGAGEGVGGYGFVEDFPGAGEALVLVAVGCEERGWRWFGGRQRRALSRTQLVGVAEVAL
jgi:hypothetical protein